MFISTKMIGGSDPLIGVNLSRGLLVYIDPVYTNPRVASIYAGAASCITCIIVALKLTSKYPHSAQISSPPALKLPAKYLPT